MLAVESSCDETAAAVVDLNQRVYSNVVASSAKVFEAYGGVVPEIASRKHMELLPHVVEKAFATRALPLTTSIASPAPWALAWWEPSSAA